MQNMYILIKLLSQSNPLHICLELSPAVINTAYSQVHTSFNQ